MAHDQVKGTTNDNQKDERCGDQEARPLEEWRVAQNSDRELRQEFRRTSPAGRPILLPSAVARLPSVVLPAVVLRAVVLRRW